MYNNPYLYQNMSNPGLLSRLFKNTNTGINLSNKGLNWGSILTNTQKSLGIINQAIPIVHQVKPIVTNAKTMFKIAGALKDNKNTTPINRIDHSINIQNNNNNDNKPIFYI